MLRFVSMPLWQTMHDAWHTPYLVEFVTLRLRVLIAIGDVPQEAVTATNEAVDALIDHNPKDQAHHGSIEKRRSSEAPHWHSRATRPEPSTETPAGKQRKACKANAVELDWRIQTYKTTRKI